MAMLEWNDKLSVGIDEIDVQHKELVRIINTVHDQMTDGDYNESFLCTIVDDLHHYAAVHFGMEESLMEKYNYPYMLNHKNKHTEFIDKIVCVANGHGRGACSINMDILNYLSDWLITHINVMDKELGVFLADKMD
ncbi:bacteriohemerythrin [Maridesulfovibrio sp.]|uniref:bacteriohemerythrin n=1 Tax=Maridesulfovibrio sp. TaxID=2795000 RepID=UPI0029F4CAFC|nr:bacteriohemerythrin [Maridesulfovibrio sp.]